MPFPAPANVDSTNGPADITDSDLQDWVAALVARSFQSEPAHLIHSWLEDAAPDAHFYLGGNAGLGRRSLVTALARQSMAQRPAPLDYCYIPKPSAMSQAYLLALPNGTGKAFAQAIDRTLRLLTKVWTSESESDNNNNSDNSDNSATQAQRFPLEQVIAEAFTLLEQASPESARSYVQQLRAAFHALAAAHAQLPATYDEMPTWLVHASSSAAEGTTQTGAPVVAGTLIRDKLDDLLIRANGGVLILPAADLTLVDGSWPSLAAALSSRRLQLKAEWPPRPLAIRVALVGDGPIYNALDNAPGDFASIFRYEAWCNVTADWTANSEAAYAVLADGVAHRHGLPPFDPSGIARLIEEGARRGDGLNRAYLSADLLLLHDIALEAGRAARVRSAAASTGEDVEAALQHRRSLQGGKCAARAQGHPLWPGDHAHR